MHQYTAHWFNLQSGKSSELGFDLDLSCSKPQLQLLLPGYWRLIEKCTFRKVPERHWAAPIRSAAFEGSPPTPFFFFFFLMLSLQIYCVSDRQSKRPVGGWQLISVAGGKQLDTAIWAAADDIKACRARVVHRGHVRQPVWKHFKNNTLCCGDSFHPVSLH